MIHWAYRNNADYLHSFRNNKKYYFHAKSWNLMMPINVNLVSLWSVIWLFTIYRRVRTLLNLWCQSWLILIRSLPSVGKYSLIPSKPSLWAVVNKVDNLFCMFGMTTIIVSKSMIKIWRNCSWSAYASSTRKSQKRKWPFILKMTLL